MGKKFHKLDETVLPIGTQSAKEVKQLGKLYLHHAKLVGNQIDDYRKLVQKLEHSPSDNQIRKAARHAANTYLKSLAGRFIAAMDENKKRDRDDRLSLSNCLALAKEVKAHKQSSEAVRIYERAKASGGFRVIHDFGLRHRTAQQMVRTLLDCRVKPRDWQYTFKGVPAAIRRIKELPVKSETWAVKLDIKDFYGHFTNSGLKKLLWDIPDSVVKASLLSEGNAFMPYGNVSSRETLSHEARRGVPQGSVASPILAALAVSQINWEPHPEVECINYAADFLLVSPSKTALKDSTLALDASVRTQLPGGKFVLKEPVFYQFGSSVEFLGHYLMIKKNALMVDPCAAAVSKLAGRLEELGTKAQAAISVFQEEDSDANRRKMLKRLAMFFAYADGWCSAFSECEEIAIDTYYSEAMDAFHKVRSMAGVSVEEVDAVLTELNKTVVSYGEFDDAFAV